MAMEMGPGFSALDGRKQVTGAGSGSDNCIDVPPLQSIRQGNKATVVRV